MSRERTDTAATAVTAARVASDVIGTAAPPDRSELRFEPILDLARGVAAGYSVTSAGTATLSPDELGEALGTVEALPRNTFISVPLRWDTLEQPAIRGALLRPAGLAGIVFELVGVSPTRKHDVDVDLEVVASIERGGGLIALHAADVWQQDFTAVTAGSPAMIILDNDWIRRLPESSVVQALVEGIGQLASDLDTWVLAKDVTSGRELASLHELGVPLARGPFIGTSAAHWTGVGPDVTKVLGPQQPVKPGRLRLMLVPSVTTSTLTSAHAAVAKDHTRHAVVVDAYGRPEALVFGLNTRMVTAGHDWLTINVDTPVRHAAARALARPESTRNDPVAATDNAGRFLGLIEMSQLNRFAYDYPQCSVPEIAATWSTVLDALPTPGTHG